MAELRYNAETMLKTAAQLVTLLALSPLGLFGQGDEEGSTAESDSEKVYLFLGGELSARQGSGNYPVLTMSKKHIVVDKGTTTKRIRKDSKVLMRLKPRISYSIVEVNRFDFSFSSTIPAAIEARALSEMMRHQWGTETEIAILPNVTTRGGRSRIDYDRIEELNRENAEFQEDMEDEARDLSFHAEKIVDTLHVELEIVPEIDYEDAYVAVAVGQPGDDESGEVGSNSQVVAGYLGTLRAGTVEEFNLRMKLQPFYEEDAVCELFLFCEEGKPIATNQSRSLKKLTRNQLEEIVRGQR